MKNGLIIFAREPLPGQVKTRLAATIGDAAAADAYAAMLDEVLAGCRTLAGIEVFVYWACAKEALPLLAERYSCRSRTQAAGDLGQRMQAAFAEMFESGFDYCCIIGSDAPDLPVSYIQEAFSLLAAQQADAIFGPSRDGGYYLLGLAHLCPQLFNNIDWSTPLVLRQSLAAATRAGIRAALLPEWYDIDTQDDFEKYRARKSARSNLSQAGAI